MHEVWKPVLGYEGVYEVSNLGRVRSLDRQVANRWGTTRSVPGTIRTIAVKREGYCFVNLFCKQRAKPMYVHRLVALAFLPNPEGLPQVNHLDGDKSNNRVDNLEWCDASQNCQHAVDQQLYESVRGEDSPSSKLTESDVIRIRQLHSDGMLQKDIAARFGVGRKAITKIVNRQRWKHVA